MLCKALNSKTHQKIQTVTFTFLYSNSHLCFCLLFYFVYCDRTVICLKCLNNKNVMRLKAQICSQKFFPLKCHTVVFFYKTMHQGSVFLLHVQGCVLKKHLRNTVLKAVSKFPHNMQFIIYPQTFLHMDQVKTSNFKYLASFKIHVIQYFKAEHT